jgi:hypothetical protein
MKQKKNWENWMSSIKSWYAAGATSYFRDLALMQFSKVINGIKKSALSDFNQSKLYLNHSAAKINFLLIL